MEQMLPVLAQEGELAVVSVDGQPVVTARALARALEYKQDWAILNLYNRNQATFTQKDTFIINSMINPKGGNPNIRVFTKRGALKICMKSNQPKAIMVQEMLIDLYEAVESRRLVPIEALQEMACRLDELTLQVQRLVSTQEQRVVYLPRPYKSRSTDEEAIEFMRRLFEAEPGQKVADAIRCLQVAAGKRGWRLGSQATLYRLAERIR